MRVVGRAGDGDAVGAVDVAALPLVLVGQRPGARPGAGIGGQRPADVLVAGDGRRRRVGRRRGQEGAGRARRAVAAAVVGRGHDDHDSVALVIVAERVAVVGRAVDVLAVVAVLVAALPLVGVGDRRRAAPGAGAGRQRPTQLHGARDDRRGRVVRRRSADRGGGDRRGDGDVGDRVGGGHDHGDRVPDVVPARRVGVVRGAGDVGAVDAVGVAALPLIRVVDRQRAGPGPGLGGERATVGRGARDARRHRVHRRVGGDGGGRAGRLGGGAAAVRRGDLHHDRVPGVGAGRASRSGRRRRRCRRSCCRRRRSAATGRCSRAGGCRPSHRGPRSACRRRARCR